MSTIRETLISSGEHIHAIRRLGKTSYSPEEYLTAVEAARDAGDGERYADAVLGPDVDAILAGADEGDDVLERAPADLRQRGVDPDAATYQELGDALARVAS